MNKLRIFLPFIAVLTMMALFALLLVSVNGCTKQSSVSGASVIEEKQSFPGIIGSPKKNSDGSTTIKFCKLTGDKIYTSDTARFSEAYFNPQKDITLITLAADSSWAKIGLDGYIYCPCQCSYIASN